MKFDQFQTIIKDKDIKNEDTQKAIFEQINNDINATIKSKEEKFEKVKTDLEAKLAESNLKVTESQRKYDEANKQALEKGKVNEELNDKLLIVSKSNVKLSDQNIRDIRTLAATRVNDSTTKEQAIEAVIAEFFGKKPEQKPKSAPSPIAKGTTPAPVKQGRSLQEMFGFGKNKKNQNLYKK